MAFNPSTDLLTAVLDRIIPPVDDLAGAGGMGLAAEVIERSRADDRFWDALVSVMSSMPSAGEFGALDGDGRDDAIRTVETAEPGAFGLWLDVVYTIYYMQPAVHRRLSWHGRPPQPEGNVMPPWDESVLDVIRQREPFWRKV
jgi:hypothetical protein